MGIFSFNQINKYQYSTIIPLMLLVSDFAIMFLVLREFSDFFFEGLSSENYLLAIVTLSLCWVLAGFFTNGYQVDNLKSVKEILQRVVFMAAAFFGFSFVLVLFLTESPISLLSLSYISLTAFSIITVVRILTFKTYKLITTSSVYKRNVIIVGISPQTQQLTDYFLNHKGLKKYQGYFDDRIPLDPLLITHYKGGFNKIKTYCLGNKIHEIYCSQSIDPDILKDLINFSDENFIQLGIIPNVGGVDYDRKVETLMLNNNRIPVILSRKSPLRLKTNSIVKRAFDILFSSLVLLILGVTIFPLVSLAILLTSPGPLFFKQLRSGKNNKPFYCLKFRSMVVNDQADTLQATDNDPRITRIGHFIRKTNIDELPQFINVLKGEMSVVGPRPHMLKHTEEYSVLINKYMLRHHAIPGITGWAQINGYRGETTEQEAMFNRVVADIWYLENWSFYLDMKIILHTIWLSAFPNLQSQITPKMDMVLK